MALIYCKDCGKEISIDCRKCPSCGAETAHGKIRGEWIGLLISCVVAFVFVIWGLIWALEYIGPFFEFMELSSSYREWVWEYDDEIQKIVWRFVFGVAFVIGGIIDACVIKKKIVALERKEQAVKQKALKEHACKTDGSLMSLAHGEWKCVCDRINKNYTYTCACGRHKRDLEKRIEVKTGRWTCKNCNSSNPPAAVACVCCGAHKPTAMPPKPEQGVNQEKPKREFVFCSECGDKNPITAKFCTGCGSALDVR